MNCCCCCVLHELLLLLPASRDERLATEWCPIMAFEENTFKAPGGIHPLPPHINPSPGL
jgi:hypothetical protein